MNRSFIFLILIAAFTGCVNPSYQLEDIRVTGVVRPVITLNGTWKLNINPPENFYMNDAGSPDWRDIQVPGECAMQGFAIKHNAPFAYKKSFVIPEDYSGKTVKLRFEGVYSYARVWINGVFIRDHNGGFTQWDCDITNQVKPGEQTMLTVEVTDRDNEISYASGYAKHQIGGILRSVLLFALPVDFPHSFNIQTKFDNKYSDAEIKLIVDAPIKEKRWISFRLYDFRGKIVNMTDKKFFLRDTLTNISLPVKRPDKWDAEHPLLYTLITFIYDRSKVIASLSTKIGFREIEIRRNKLLVNGQQVKLRGACRHDINPLLGRMSTPEYDKMDVLLAKEANMNFIRTSHYPPTDSFLKYCDEYGLYVEEETAVCFVNTHRGGIYKSLEQSGPAFEPQMISQVEEMITGHRNHPSVIIWSVGNENVYNPSFRKCYNLIKSADITRPVMFSYPGSVPDSVKCYDIVSMHYPSYDGDIEQYGIKIKKFKSQNIPVLFDEWAHIPCYDKPELLEDKNVRNFWGESLDSMWTNVFKSDGSIGGAIWGMIDETFQLPDTLSGLNKWWGIPEGSKGMKMYEGPVVGYGEWGIVDTWRRKKPEFWNTKKAYSPTRILINEITDFKPGSPLIIPVFNRFNHTNLREIVTKWNYRNKIGIARNHNIDPFEKGIIRLPPQDWHEGEYLNIKFLGKDSSLIDEYNLRLGKREAVLPHCEGEKILAKEVPGGKVEIRGTAFSLCFDRTTGLLKDVVSNNDTLIKSGPFLHFRYPAAKHSPSEPMAEIRENWRAEEAGYSIKDGILNITVNGTQGLIKLRFNITIGDNGTIIISYMVNGIPENSSAEEFGLKFLTGNYFDKISWDRKSYWNAYPGTDPGMPQGSVNIFQKNRNVYREKPAGAWEFDNMSFYYNGLSESDNLSNIAGSMKENIYTFSLSTPGKSALTIFSATDKACRIGRKNNLNYLYINKYWDYSDLNWGNYTKNQILPKEIEDTIYMKIN